jgi:sugar/nucleoside kinase (ribokinase family)
MPERDFKILQLPARSHPVVLGTGLVALDVVIPNGLAASPQLRVGGTCGNVLTILAYLGWQSYPVARLRSDGASKEVTNDLRRWGVSLDFVSYEEDGSTPVVIQHIRSNGAGDPIHSFSRKCPSCGAILPWYKAVRVADIETIARRLPKPHVFFFDRISAGALSLASTAREAGALIVFEPSASSDPRLLEKALDVSDIVKVSSDRVAGNRAVLTSSTPALIIETLGSNGLRMRLNRHSPEGRRWHTMPAIPVDSVRDTAGAGDWCTAGIIHILCARGSTSVSAVGLREIQNAIQVGQAMASWTCGFDGSRGGMYDCSKARFRKHIERLLEGEVEPRSPASPITQSEHIRQLFSCESCRTRRRSRANA